jgi:hypothetical protein
MISSRAAAAIELPFDTQLFNTMLITPTSEFSWRRNAHISVLDPGPCPALFD